jgi:predicted Rossmann-fold nucleotide-binding protein
VIFPGGFGTLDELFEVLTLAQTAKLGRRIPVLLYGSGYWKEIIDFAALVRHGVIAAADLELLTWVDDPQTAFATLTRQLARIRCDEGIAFAPSRSSVNGDAGMAPGATTAPAGCAACAARALAGA